MTQAKDLYNQLYKDKTVTEQANQASLDQVKQLIGQIKNPKIRDSFTEGLQAIESTVQAQATTQAETTTDSATNTDGTVNQDTTMYDNTTPYYGGNTDGQQNYPNPTPQPNPAPQPDPTPQPDPQPEKDSGGAGTPLTDDEFNENGETDITW